MHTHPVSRIRKRISYSSRCLAVSVMMGLVLSTFLILNVRPMSKDDLLVAKLDLYDWLVQTHTVTRIIEGCDWFVPSGDSADVVRCRLFPGLDFCARPQSSSLRISDMRGVIVLEYAFIFSNTMATAVLPVKPRVDQRRCNTPIQASFGDDWRYSVEWGSEWRLLSERDKKFVYKCVKNRFGRTAFDRARKAYVHKFEGVNCSRGIYCFRSEDTWYVWGEFCVSAAHKGALLGPNLSDEEIIEYILSIRGAWRD